MKNKAANLCQYPTKSQRDSNRPKSDSALGCFNLSRYSRGIGIAIAQLPANQQLLRSSNRQLDPCVMATSANKSMSNATTRSKNALTHMYPQNEAKLSGEVMDRQKLSRRLLRISRQRDRALQIRSQLTFEQKNTCYARDFLYESIQQFMDVLQDAVASQTLNTRSEELRHLYHRCEDDRVALEAKELRVTTLQTDLERVEFQLMKLERRVALPNADDIYLSDIAPTDSTSEDSHESSSDIPSMLERYYDRKGEVGVQLERLDDLQQSYLEEKEHRDFLEDRGELTGYSELKMSSQYEEQRGEILYALQAAQQEAEDLAIACKTAGISIDGRRWTRESPAQSVDPSPDTRGLLPATLPFLTPTGDPSTSSKPSCDAHPHTEVASQAIPGNTHASVFAWLNTTSTESPLSQHFSIEGLDLASKLHSPKNACSAQVDKWWLRRHYSDEGVTHSSDGVREIRAQSSNSLPSSRFCV